jgi:HEAT repeat protein
VGGERKHPVVAASELRRKGDVDALLALLTDTNIVNRRTAAHNLGEMRSARAVEPLIRCLLAGDEVLRLSALNALAKIGDSRSAQDIFAVATTDESARVRGVAVSALVDVGDPRAAELMVQMLDKGNGYSRAARKWASRGLVALGATEAIPALEAPRDFVGILERWRLRRLAKAIRAAGQGKAGGKRS